MNNRRGGRVYLRSIPRSILYIHIIQKGSTDLVLIYLKHIARCFLNSETAINLLHFLQNSSGAGNRFCGVFQG